MKSLILALNPGATSTKVALFCDGVVSKEQTWKHPDSELSRFPRVIDQLNLRAELLSKFLTDNGVGTGQLSAVVGRGGLLRPLASGTYLVNDVMLRDLADSIRGEHASNLGAAMADTIARERGCKAYVVDPVAVDEMDDVARFTGLKGIERQSMSHALNMKAVCKRYGKSIGRRYEDLHIVVAHLGTGTSLSAHKLGLMVDVINPKDEGPISADRAGTIPTSALVDLCFRPGAEARSVKKILFGDGGLYSHLGTRDLREALLQAENGNAYAGRVVESMCYQVAKYIGEMAVVLEGKVDAILLTGGMIHNPPVCQAISRRVAWIAPVKLYPGEDELCALAEGCLRVLTGEEHPLVYGLGS